MPINVKLIIQALQMIADKKKRQRFFAVLGAAILIPILFLMMVFYTITAPLRWVQNLFSNDEIYELEQIRIGQGFPPWGSLEAGIVYGFYCPFPGINWLVTSPFGIRVHPITGNIALHQGVDIAWYRSYGTPIGAIADGIVTFAGYSTSAGWWVIIYHGDIGFYDEYGIFQGFRGVVSVYMHNSANRVLAGDWVYAGDIIGTLGTSGMSTGPHLHLEIRLGGWNGLNNGRVSGTAVDPLQFIGLPGMREVANDYDF